MTGARSKQRTRRPGQRFPRARLGNPRRFTSELETAGTHDEAVERREYFRWYAAPSARPWQAFRSFAIASVFAPGYFGCAVVTRYIYKLVGTFGVVAAERCVLCILIQGPFLITVHIYGDGLDSLLFTDSHDRCLVGGAVRIYFTAPSLGPGKSGRILGASGSAPARPLRADAALLLV